MRGITAAALLFLSFLTGCATRQGGSIDEPIPTTIQAVDANPEQYRGKFIAIRGVIGRCLSRGGSCGMEQAAPGTLPEAHAPNISVNFMSRTEALAPGADPDGGAIAGRMMNELYRFSEVTLVGLYDGGCTSGRGKSRRGKDGMEEIVVCYDGYGSDLWVAYVAAVHKRWPATAWAEDADPEDRVSAAPEAAAVRIFSDYKAALIAAGHTGEAEDASANHRVFLYDAFPDAGVICVCRTESCEGAWPSLRAHLVPAPASPYYCVDADRTGGRWHFAPGR